ncbi:hypothetical protein [Pseudomonas helvetica]|uniref:hypothetical protein n=1 Tax=Pseudomonas helvetica TaxID=3136738 RepID=UPI0032666EB6
MYNEFDKCISLFSVEMEAPDYWHDVGVIHASSLLEEFTGDDWSKILGAVVDKSDAWLVRLCEAIGGFPSDDALLVLLKVIGSNNREVFFAALESIRSMVFVGTDVSKYLREIELAVVSGKEIAD